MIYGDDVTHIVTEEGIANLLLVPQAGRSANRRSAAWPATPTSAAGGTAGWSSARASAASSAGPRISASIRSTRDRQLLAARSIKDLVHWSGGLYRPPSKFRNW